MITSKTGTSQIVWALNPLVPLYRPSPRKRPTLPLKNKFNPLLPASTTVSNSFNSSLESLSLQITQYLFNYSLSCPISYLSCAFFHHFTSNQFKHFVFPSILIQSLSCQSLHSLFSYVFHSPAQTLIISINYYQFNSVV